ncbi:MAG: hypothetical protein QM308_07110 [Bacillota bacterium]|nr:hypothetical protein [Bacillota bacterium]
MQNKPAKKSSRGKVQPVKKPYLKGNAFSPLALRRGLGVFVYIAVSALLFLFMGQLMVLDVAWLRVAINIAVVVGFASLMYSSGVNRGENDVSFAEIALTRQQEGKPVSKDDLNKCFHPAKGYVTMFFGALPFVLLCLIHALAATRETYSLGALPAWLSAYQNRLDISLALHYYNDVKAFGLADGVRIITRLLVFPFVNIAGQGNPDGILLVERLSPLLVLLAPFFYGVGYQRGEAFRALVHGGIASNAKSTARRQKKKAAARRNEPKQLV